MQAEIKKFPGKPLGCDTFRTPFGCRTFPDDNEAVNFAEIILKLLFEAGWTRNETTHLMATVD
jgi:hypothetical protein